MDRLSHVKKEMMSYLSHPHTAPVTPLYDTWKWKKHIGDWAVSLPFDRDASSLKDTNYWYAEQLKQSLSSFRPWLRAWKIYIGGVYLGTREILEDNRCWDFNQSQDDFLNDVSRRIQEYPALVGEVVVHVDMLVYTRTEQSPHQPVRAWVRNYAKFRFSINLGEGYVAFYVYGTLFCRYSPLMDDNEELYNLNHPMLSASLQAWEKQCGEIYADGFFGMYSHGFSPNWNK